MEPDTNRVESVIAPLKKVTPLSKYLAMTLFVMLPFLGGWIGYSLSPGKVVEVVNILDKTKTLESGSENWGLPNESTRTEITSETTYNESLLGCDSQIYSIIENVPFTDFLGL